jgi:hypothetical protein
VGTRERSIRSLDFQSLRPVIASPNRPPTASNWMTESLQSYAVIAVVGNRKPSGGARGTPSRRQVSHGPYDPSFEMPDEGGPNERLAGDSIPRRVTPSRVRLAVFKPAQSSLFEPRPVRALISGRASRVHRSLVIHLSQAVAPTEASVAGLRPPWSCSGLRCALEYGLEAQHLLPLLPTMVESPSS